MAQDVLYHELPLESFSVTAGDDNTLVIEGWLSTSQVFPRYRSRLKWKVLPTAFTPRVIDEYMQKPVVCFMHEMDKLAVGRTLALEVRGEGVWIRVVIFGTRDGLDIQKLIRGKAINSFSFLFLTRKDRVERETAEDGSESYLTIIEELEKLIEVSVCNLGRNEGAIFTIADDQKFSYCPISDQDGKEEVVTQSHKGGVIMPDEIKNADQFATKDELSAIGTSVQDVKRQIGDIGSLTNELKAFREQTERTMAENRQFVERLSSDFTSAVKELRSAVAERQERKVGYGDREVVSFSIGEIMEMPERRLASLFRDNRYAQLSELRRTNDHLLLVDAIKMKSNDEEYKARPFEDRVRSLKTFKELQTRAFAVDTATSGEGSEYLPTGYSSRMMELIRVESTVFNMHESFTMTNSIQVLPVEGADTLATLEGEKTTVVSAFNTTEQTPGSANVTFTAKKARGRTQWSGEADEDLIISMADYVERKVARSIKRAIARATISGDLAGGTAYDSGDVPTATDYRYGMNGYRQGILSGSKIDLSTFSEKNLNKVQAAGGKYMRFPTQFFWLTSIKGYLLHFLDPDEVPSVRTVDKYGPAATIVTGELAKYNGAPILVDEWILDTFDNAGVYSGPGQTKTIILCVNRESWMYGLYKPMAVEIVRDAHNDVYDVIARQRLQIQSIYDRTTEPTVTQGYNVSTT